MNIIIIVGSLVLIDIITGIISSCKNGVPITSKKAKEGFYSKLGLFVAIAFGYVIDVFLNYLSNLDFVFIDTTNFFNIGTIISIYICINESISIIENLSNINSKLIPNFIKKFFENAENNLNNK